MDAKATNGVVVERRMANIWYFVQRPKLRIQVEDTRETVYAILSMNAIHEIPDQVTFSFSGDPSAEVYLFEEDYPLWFALFFLLTPLLALVLISWLLNQRLRPNI